MWPFKPPILPAVVPPQQPSYEELRALVCELTQQLKINNQTLDALMRGTTPDRNHMRLRMLCDVYGLVGCMVIGLRKQEDSKAPWQTFVHNGMHDSVALPLIDRVRKEIVANLAANAPQNANQAFNRAS